MRDGFFLCTYTHRPQMQSGTYGASNPATQGSVTSLTCPWPPCSIMGPNRESRVGGRPEGDRLCHVDGSFH